MLMVLDVLSLSNGRTILPNKTSLVSERDVFQLVHSDPL